MIKSYLPFYKRNIIIAIPVMLSQAGQVMVQQVDSMMVGRVGTIELAASSFANSIFIAFMVLAMGFTFAVTPIVGHLWASGDKDQAAAILRNSSISNTLLSFILVILMYLFSFLFPYMGQSPEVVSLATPYYLVLVASMLPFMFFYNLKQFSEGLGNTIYAMLITLIANLVNIIFNYFLIFGTYGFPQLGLEGAGYATLISRVFMALAFAIVFLKHPMYRDYVVLARKAKTQIKLIGKVLSLGWPISLQMLLEVSAFSISGIMVGWLGAVPLAAHQIALGLASVAFMIATGISSGTTIRISHQYSEKNFVDLKKAAYASVHLVLAFMTCSAIAFVVFRNQLPYLYTNDTSVIPLASSLLIMVAFFQLFDGLQLIMLGILRGLADVKRAMVYSFISYILINIPLGYFLGFTMGFGTIGIWVGLIVGLGIASLLFLSRFKKTYKKILENGK